MSWYGPETMIGQFRRFRRARAILREHVIRDMIRHPRLYVAVVLSWIPIRLAFEFL